MSNASVNWKTVIVSLISSVIGALSVSLITIDQNFDFLMGKIYQSQYWEGRFGYFEGNIDESELGLSINSPWILNIERVDNDEISGSLWNKSNNTVYIVNGNIAVGGSTANVELSEVVNGFSQTVGVVVLNRKDDLMIIKSEFNVIPKTVTLIRLPENARRY